jgi:hypothetical protein
MKFEDPKIQRAYDSCGAVLKAQQAKSKAPPKIQVYVITFTSDENTAKRVLAYIHELPTTNRSFRFYPEGVNPDAKN